MDHYVDADGESVVNLHAGRFFGGSAGSEPESFFFLFFFEPHENYFHQWVESLILGDFCIMII